MKVPADPVVDDAENVDDSLALPSGPSLKELASSASAATNWDVTVDEMWASAHRDGLAPVTVHCSTGAAAVERLTEMLLDPEFVPVRRTPAPVVVELPGNDSSDNTELPAVED